MNKRMNQKSGAQKLVVCIALLACLLLSACGREEEAPEASGEETAAVYDGREYPGTMSLDKSEEQSGSLGIMYATVMDVAEGSKESQTVYTVKDHQDPDNAWSFSALEIGHVAAEMKTGQEIALLFFGDIVNEAEELQFIAAVPAGNYTIKKASGVTVSNTIMSFVIRTGLGKELEFIKDNCYIESGAMDGESGGEITVYYADGGSELYPMRVYKRKS